LACDLSRSDRINSRCEQFEFLRYKDQQNRFLDFHASRHTRGVWLFDHHDVKPREVQELLGEGSIALIDRYTKSMKTTDLSVIDRRPELGKSRPLTPKVAAMQKNSTANEIPPKSLAPSLAQRGGFRRTSPYFAVLWRTRR